MELSKFDKLKEKIESKDFENKNKSLKDGLYYVSFLGNIGSIFFAYFLLNPAIYKAFSAYLNNMNIAAILAGLLTVIILIIFEFVKRQILSNLSFDLIKGKFKFHSSLIGWSIASIILITASFYFSLNGAMDFASTKNQQVDIISSNYDVEIDSIRLVYFSKIKEYEDDNKIIQELTNDYRRKYTELPDTYVTGRRELQASIDANSMQIERNNNRINLLQKERDDIIQEYKNQMEIKINQVAEEDQGNIIIFLIISTSIELIIILGVYFKELFEIKVYRDNHMKLSAIVEKRDRYRILVKYIYKNGKADTGERVLGKDRLIELIKQKSKITNPKTLVDDFMNDMMFMNVFIMRGTRRYTNVSYNKAMELINNFDDTMRVLEDLK